MSKRNPFFAIRESLSGLLNFMHFRVFSRALVNIRVLKKLDNNLYKKAPERIGCLPQGAMQERLELQSRAVGLSFLRS